MNNAIDICDFINSAAIAEHCRKIKHRFSYTDMAYLIWASEKHSVEEKHSAWRTLTETMPDTEIAERPWTPHIESLHAFLRRYMELQNKYISLFYREEPSCVYSYGIWYRNDETYADDSCIFPTFQICFDAICAETSDAGEDTSDKPQYIRVKKQWINQTGIEPEKYITLYINAQGKPMDIYDSRNIILPEDDEILDAFRGMWPEIPTPFKHGDILFYHNRHRCCKDPFVLDSLPYWDESVPERTLHHLRIRGDESDLSSTVYFLSNDGKLWRDHGPSYLEMEYHNEELKGTQKILSVLAGFLRKEYDIATFLEAYEYLKNIDMRAKTREHLCAYNNQSLIAADFDEKCGD